MNSPQTIPEICAALEKQGHPDLAQRIAYFASDEDLEEGDAPVTLESALGFWEFFSAVIPGGNLERLDLACSTDGHVSASWEFCDGRGATIWFPDVENVMFALQDADGKFFRVNGKSSCDRPELLTNLVEASLFAWRPKTREDKSLPPGITLPVIAGDDT